MYVLTQSSCRTHQVSLHSISSSHNFTPQTWWQYRRFLTNRCEYIDFLPALPQFPCFEFYTWSCPVQLCVGFCFPHVRVYCMKYIGIVFVLILQQEMKVWWNAVLVHMTAVSYSHVKCNRFQRWSISSSNTSSMLLWKGLTILMHVL